MCVQGESLRQKDSRGTPRDARGVSVFAPEPFIFHDLFSAPPPDACAPGVARARVPFFQPEN